MTNHRKRLDATAPVPAEQRTHLIAAAVLAHRNGGYAYVNDEGHQKGPIHPADIPDDAIAIIAPSPVVVRGGQYLRRLRRRHNAARKDT